MLEIPTVEGAYFDEMKFYNLPDGSFYDPDGHYFDKDGKDEFGGYYDSKNNYIPGEGNRHLFEDDNEDDDFMNDPLIR